MKIFLSHSSADRGFVTLVRNELSPRVAWLDAAELELGDIILEKVSSAIEEASDFLLFWSQAASNSQWVRLELNMAFIRMLERRACRVRVVRLDQTELPLHLKPYLYLDASAMEEGVAVQALRETLLEGEQRPKAAVRRQFVNRNEDVDRLERAIDDQEISCICVTGIQGIGKRSLVKEGLRRLFEGVDIRPIEIRAGTGIVELSLQLSALAGNQPVPPSADLEALRREIRRGIEVIHSADAFLVLFDIQHWLDEDATPNELLSWLVSVFQGMPALCQRPVIMTSTRTPNIPVSHRRAYQRLRVGQLANEHLEALLRYWLNLELGERAERTELKSMVDGLFGYPLAARFAAALIAQYGPTYLDEHPVHIIELRVALATHLLADLPLNDEARKLAEALAMVDAPLPGADLAAALGFSDAQYGAGVERATAAGIVDYDDNSFLIAHPLVRDYFWRSGLHRADYKRIALTLAQAARKRLDQVEVGTIQHSVLLPATFRLLALAGHLQRALRLRRDLMGQLSEAAIILYNRRDYELCLRYAQHVLDEYRHDWRMRLYKARALTRLGRVPDAEGILRDMLEERPRDPSVLHALGRAKMMGEDYEGALERFTQALATRDGHVASLRDAAQCLVLLERPEEARKLIDRAKAIEPENAYVLALESRILEDEGAFDEAYSSMLIALRGDPQNAQFHHRLGKIAGHRADNREAVKHYTRAVELDPGLLEARFSRVSVNVDLDELDTAEAEIRELETVRLTARQKAVLATLLAKLHKAKGELEHAADLLKSLSRKKPADIEVVGLRAEVELALAAKKRAAGYTVLAEEHFERAAHCVQEGLDLDPDNILLLRVQAELAARSST